MHETILTTKYDFLMTKRQKFDNYFVSMPHVNMNVRLILRSFDLPDKIWKNSKQGKNNLIKQRLDSNMHQNPTL